MDNGISEAELMRIISGNLKSLMEDRRCNQKELAEDSRLSEGAISNYVNGRKLPSLRAVMNLCAALDCDVEDIIGFIDYVY